MRSRNRKRSARPEAPLRAAEERLCRECGSPLASPRANKCLKCGANQRGLLRTIALVTVVAAAITAVLQIIAPGGILGILKQVREVGDLYFGRVDMQFKALANNDRALQFSIENTGDDVLEVRNFRIEHIDDDLGALLHFGRLYGAADVAKGRHEVNVEVEYIKPADSLQFFEIAGRESFFARYGTRPIRFAADVTRRGARKTIHADVTLSDIRAFVANRASPSEVTP